MKLLIKRDPTGMIKTQGRMELDSDVPETLRAPRIVPSRYVDKMQTRQNDDLFIMTSRDYDEIDNHLHLRVDSFGTPVRGVFSGPSGSIEPNFLSGNQLLAVWSGYRSVLVSSQNRDLYRLKGVSFNPENPVIQKYKHGCWEVFGGQPLQSARFEKQMSDKFNCVLAREGITPVMTCKGYWHYPLRVKGDKLAASVVKVEGDTRLDEFMYLIENYFISRINWEPKVNREGYRLHLKIKQLYKDMGFCVGNLKNLMDRNYQTWSSDNERSNAHIGNVVLYNGTDKVRLGFVDFDASCDTNDYSKSKIEELQKLEHKTILNSANAGPISPRKIQAGFLRGDEIHVIAEWRDEFAAGFELGYQNIGPRASLAWVINGIDFSRFVDIFTILRSRVSLKDAPVPLGGYRGLEDLISEPIRNIKYPEDKGNSFDPYNILRRNKRYQDSLLSNYLLDKGDQDYGLDRPLYKDSDKYSGLISYTS